MSKLRSKLKVAAKRKSRRESVAKRKAERIQKEQDAKSANDQERRIEAEVDEIIRKEAGESDSDDSEAAARLGGLVVSKPQLAQNKKKQLSRKQLKRQEKHRDRGEATASALDKKWVDKKVRVKHRAQVRNAELGHD